MNPTLQSSSETPSAAAKLDAAVQELTRAAVREVFQEMLTLEMADDASTPLAPEAAGQIVTSVGFVGGATGVIHLNSGIHFAKIITGRMLGLEEAEVEDDMLNDAFAELGNVVVGWVKSHLSDRGWSCALTIPSLLRGHQLSVEDIADATRGILGFRTGDHRLLVEMFVRNPK